MNKRLKKENNSKPVTKLGNVPVEGDLYTVTPTEKPLHDTMNKAGERNPRRTSRHHVHKKRQESNVDPRDKAALVAVLRYSIIIVILIISFFLLKRGIDLYEKNIEFKYRSSLATSSPILGTNGPIEDSAVEKRTLEEQIPEFVRRWNEVERHVRAADALLERKIYEQAIERCQQALALDHTHIGALQRLSEMYYLKGNYRGSVNTLVKVLNIDPSREEIQKNLILSLVALKDWKSVVAMAEWYLNRNGTDLEIQKYLAQALYAEERYEEVVPIDTRILTEEPENVASLKRLGKIYIRLGQYAKAAECYKKLRNTDNEKPEYYRELAVCYAQLHQPNDTVNVLARASNIFGERVVIEWLKDVSMDAVRGERVIQQFVDRVADEKTRKWLELLAENMKKRETKIPKVKVDADTEKLIELKPELRPRK